MFQVDLAGCFGEVGTGVEEEDADVVVGDVFVTAGAEVL